MSQIEKLDKPTIENVVEIIRPYEQINYQKLGEQELKRRAHKYISRPKDENGVRTYFFNNKGSYTNVETTNNKEELNGIKKHLNKKYAGIIKSRKKVINREKVLSGQISLFEGENHG